MSKTVPKSKFTEWKGLDRIQLIVHEMKCIWREMEKDDFGIDGEIELVVQKDDGSGYRATGRFVKVQAKSGARYVVNNNEVSFASPVEKRDLELWHDATFPVLYIVYSPKDDKLYAKEVKEYVRSDPKSFQAPYRIPFNKQTDEFTVDFFDNVAALAGASPSRIDFEGQELFFGNLLPVTRLPTMYEAKTEIKKRDEVFDELEGDIPPFWINSNRFRTFDDLFNDASTLRAFTSGGITKTQGRKAIGDEERNRDYVFLLNRLLKDHLFKRAVLFNKKFRRYYFRKPKKGKDRKEDWVSIRTGKKAPPRTVAAYYEYGKEKHITFWRHLAASIRFKEIAGTLYLQIVPKYFFTTDGKLPWDSDLVGPYTTRIKSREFNPQVLNHVLFWAYYLADGKRVISLRQHGKVILTAKCQPITAVSPFALRLDPALLDEPSTIEHQPTLFGDADFDDLDGEDED